MWRETRLSTDFFLITCIIAALGSLVRGTVLLSGIESPSDGSVNTEVDSIFPLMDQQLKSRILNYDQYDNETNHLISEAVASTTNPSISGAEAPLPRPRYNVVLIVMDQLRFDTLGFVQRRMKQYDGKLKIRTPNIDALAAGGAYFETAYCQSPSCGPARASLKTGCTVARTGLNGNKMTNPSFYKLMKLIKNKVMKLETFEQLLVNKFNYTAQTFGKWHVPKELYYSRLTDSVSGLKKRVIEYNRFDYRQNELQFLPQLLFKEFYQNSLSFFREIGEVQLNHTNGTQLNYYSNAPYIPVQIDSRYGMPTNVPLEPEEGFNDYEEGESSMCGRDLLDPNYTSTAVMTDMALRGLNRMIDTYHDGLNPFLLGIHYNSPHPPVIAASKWMDYYYNRREDIFVPPSINDEMKDSEYAFHNQRRYKSDEERPYPYDDADKIAELTAIYYGLIEEVDHHIGLVVRAIENAGLMRDTMIILTSDHGDMLGAHGMTGKGLLLEEATRVPLIISFPGKIREDTLVKEPASHLDVFATILDYLGVPPILNKSDGQSLRRFVEGVSWNREHDEGTVVVELDRRIPESKKEFTGELGDTPNFMIRKGDFKLIVPRRRDSPVRDMMYNLTADPFEMTNVLTADASSEIIGKAEHLKIMLIEWLQRKNTADKLYSSNDWNLGVGKGDIAEIKNRRTWREVIYWQSDRQLRFGDPVMQDRMYVRREFLYVGRTKKGSLNIDFISVQGRDARYFSVGQKANRSFRLETGEFLRIPVTFMSNSPRRIADLDAQIVIKNDANGERIIPIVCELHTSVSWSSLSIDR